MKNFYNDSIENNNIQDASSYDEHGNPEGSVYDLGRDGAFNRYAILIGEIYVNVEYNIECIQKPINALKKKGFKVKYVTNRTDFISELQTNKYKIAWVICSKSSEDNNIVSSLTNFHAAGGAIFLLPDNEPFIYPASQFLNQKFGITLNGNYSGEKILTFKQNGQLEAGHFGQHAIFTGIQNLYEGITICHPVYSTSESRAILATVATSTDGNPNIAVYDPPATSTEGRLCLDCGFTKLYKNWDEAGTARYVVNASCWLTGIDRRK
ncbi:unnamed protein product [Rotaria sp. Silwood1]|nr:unnamed protein product [Rotaria sp. Silwood1]